MEAHGHGAHGQDKPRQQRVWEVYLHEPEHLLFKAAGRAAPEQRLRWGAALQVSARPCQHMLWVGGNKGALAPARHHAQHLRNTTVSSRATFHQVGLMPARKAVLRLHGDDQVCEEWHA